MAPRSRPPPVSFPFIQPVTNSKRRKGSRTSRNRTLSGWTIRRVKARWNVVQTKRDTRAYTKSQRTPPCKIQCAARTSPFRHHSASHE
eukprot:6478691-Amphidinium_carterae.1